MATASSYTIGGSTQSLSFEYTTIDELLTGLLDNASGAIQAIDVRNPVYTLWQRIESFSASLALTGTAATQYISLTPSTNVQSVGGVPFGSTFSGTIQDALNRIFYPYLAPTPTISSLSNREFGSSLTVNLAYNVSLGTFPIVPTTLVVAGVSKIFPPYSGIHNTSATHSVAPLTASQSSSFVISVSDGVNTITGTQTFYWMNRIYWGRVNLTSISNPNLTLDNSPATIAQVASVCTDSVIRNLTGAGANGLMIGSELSVVKEKFYEGIDGQGQYLVFAWPSTVPNSMNPIFRVNGVINTAFTRVRTNSPLVNSFGFSGTDYEVWITNTRYNSTVDIEIS